MKYIKQNLIFVCLFSVLSLLLCSCSESEKKVEIEKAKYTVIEEKGNCQIRQYEPYIAAETLVDSDFDEAGNIAFGRLFKYISGNNRKKESIAMTSPVNQQSEKIAMTAPVSQEKSADKYIVSFVMPSKYTLDTLPEPIDPNVVIKQIPARKIAAIRYSGTWGQKRYLEHKTKLEEFIKEKKLKVTGEDIFARYDPPFQVWFLRRNEVWIPVE
ncbi:MAG: heme-binding protein [Planctomycetes bacterium GWF2_42_9]|nr:MAG: heme-binding protein [Planctomycetes bacterium GWF2_42_9]